MGRAREVEKYRAEADTPNCEAATPTGAVYVAGDEMVGASGFEPPASWSRTTTEREINNLAGLLRISRHCDMLFWKR